MQHRRVGLIVWLVTTFVVVVGGLAVYDALTDPGDLPGRSELQSVLADPERLLTDPGALGSAVEARAHHAVAQCMAAAGFDYRSPVSIEEDLDEVADPAVAGYGISAGVAAPEFAFVEDTPRGADRLAYEAALYGEALTDGEGTSGCAAVGRAEVEAASATLQSLPYSLVRLETEARGHPSWARALERWRTCMRDAGFSYDSPDAIVIEFRNRLAGLRGDDARALADLERTIAVADTECRTGTLEPAIAEIAQDLAPAFVEANRTQLESLLPPNSDDPDLPPELGGGDIQVTLRWPSATDLDLSVTAPTGTRIYHGNRTGAGAELDRDANANCTIGSVGEGGQYLENIYWSDDAAPPGTYVARVTLFDACSEPTPLAYELIIQVDGRVVQWIRTTIASGSVDVTFEVGS